MCIPTNWVKGDWIWGTVDGKEITGDDREAAGRLYIDELLRRWKAAKFNNIELDGIYWTKESFHENLDDHVRAINCYSRENDLLVYWIPYVSAYYKRLVDYVDHYEDQDVFDTKPVAYYSGFQGFYDFETLGNDKDREIMDRIARIINMRHQATGWDKAPAKINK